MKKSILLVACLILLTVGAISVSCSKDKEWKGCRCTYYEDGEKGTHTESASKLKEEGIESCAELQAEAEDSGSYTSVSCSDL
jgi:hypothetical protein